MTEQKKAFIADALDAVADEFIAEAVEYQKTKLTWKYTRELATVAACAAVLLVSLNVIRMIPIGSTEKATNDAMAENMQEVTALESFMTDVTGTPETKLEDENAVVDEAMQQENADQIVKNEENFNKVVGAEQSKEALYSKGITWREVSKAQMQAEKETCGYPTLESIQTSSCAQWMSAEEILALDVEIFMGTVTDMKTYHVSGGMGRYFTVATVEVEDSIRSELEMGDTCRIYLPFAKVGGLTTTTSIIGDLEKLEIGSRAIFMPRKATEEAGEGSGDVWLSYLDFSDYYFGEGMRFLFLETENGTSYATDVYEVEGGNEASLEKIAAYLRGVLEK